MKFKDLPPVEEKTQDIIKKLKEKYPGLDTYPVYSTLKGQVDLGMSAVRCFGEFPEMFIDGAAKSQVKKLLAQRNAETKDPAKDAELDQELKEKTPDLEIHSDVQVELRFGDIKYHLVARLKVDPAVDRTLTPQDPVSIRIVLGTVGDLGKRITES